MYVILHDAWCMLLHNFIHFFCSYLISKRQHIDQVTPIRQHSIDLTFTATFLNVFMCK